MFAFVSLLFLCVNATQYVMVGTNSEFQTSSNWSPTPSTLFTVADDLIVSLSGSFGTTTLKVNSIKVTENVDLTLSTMTTSKIEGTSTTIFTIKGVVTLNGNCTGNIKVRRLQGSVINNGYLLVETTPSLTVINHGTLDLGSFETGEFILSFFNIENYGNIIYAKPIENSDFFRSYSGTITFEYQTLSISAYFENTNILTDLIVLSDVYFVNCVGKGLVVNEKEVSIVDSVFTNVDIINSIVNGWTLKCQYVSFAQSGGTDSISFSNTIINCGSVLITGNWLLSNSQIGGSTKVLNSKIQMGDQSIFFGSLDVELTTINQIFFNGTNIVVDSCTIDYVLCNSFLNYTLTTIKDLDCYSECLIGTLSVNSIQVYSKSCVIKNLDAEEIIQYSEEWFLPTDLIVSNIFNCSGLLECVGTCSFISTASTISWINFVGSGDISLTISGVSEAKVISTSKLQLKSVGGSTNLYLTMTSNNLISSTIVKQLICTNSTITSSGNIETLKATDSTLSITNKNGYIILDEITNCFFIKAVNVVSGSPKIKSSTFLTLTISSPELTIESSTITGTLYLTSTTVIGSCTTDSFVFEDVLLNNFNMTLSSCLNKYTAINMTSVDSSFTIPCITRLSSVESVLDVDIYLKGESYIGYGTSLTAKSITNYGSLQNFGSIKTQQLISEFSTSSIGGTGTIESTTMVVSCVGKNTMITKSLFLSCSNITFEKLQFKHQGSMNQRVCDVFITDLTIENGLNIINTTGFITATKLTANGIITGNLLVFKTQTSILTNIETQDSFEVYTLFDANKFSANVVSSYGSVVKLASGKITELRSTNSLITISGTVSFDFLILDKSEINAWDLTTIVTVNGLLECVGSINVPIIVNYYQKGTIVFKKYVKMNNIYSSNPHTITLESEFECSGHIQATQDTFINMGNMKILEGCSISSIIDNRNQLVVENTFMNFSTLYNSGTASIVNVTAEYTLITSTSLMTLSQVSGLSRADLMTGSTTKMKGDISSVSFKCDGVFSIEANATLDFSDASLRKCQMQFPSPVYHLHFTKPSQSTPYLVSVIPSELPSVGDNFYLVSCEKQPFLDKPTSDVSGVDVLALSRDLGNDSYNISIHLCPSGSSYILHCVQCLSGEYQIEEKCYKCPSGTYSDGFNCIKCEEGYFSLNASKECDKCGSGMWSLNGSSDCYYCSSGYFKDSTKGCVECPSGHISGIGADNCTLCDGGMMTLDHVNCILNETTPENNCSKGYYFDYGRCVECKNGYEPNEARDGCVVYAKNQWKLQLIIILFFLLVFVIFGIILAIHVINYYKEQKRDVERKKFVDRMFGIGETDIEEEKPIKKMTPSEWLYPDFELNVEANFGVLRTLKKEGLIEKFKQYQKKGMSEEQKIDFENDVKNKETRMEKFSQEFKGKIQGNVRTNSNLSSNLEIELEETKPKLDKSVSAQAGNDQVIVKQVTQQLGQIETEKQDDTDELGDTEKKGYTEEIEDIEEENVQQQMAADHPIENNEKDKKPEETLKQPQIVGETTEIQKIALTPPRNRPIPNNPKIEVSLAMSEINKLKEQYEKDLLSVKTMVRSLSYETSETKEKVKKLEEKEEQKEQKELKERKEEQKKKAGIEGGSRVQDILIAGVNPRFIPLSQNKGSTSYIK